MTKPTGVSPSYTARYQGIAYGVDAASANESATPSTNFSCAGSTRSDNTSSQLAAVISRNSTVGMEIIVQGRFSDPG